MESPGLGITDAYELLSGSWEMNLGSLQERQELLIAETSLQPLYWIFFEIESYTVASSGLEFPSILLPQLPQFQDNKCYVLLCVPNASWFGPQVLTCRFSEQLMWKITNANNVLFSVGSWIFSYSIRQMQGAGETTRCPLVSCVNVVWRVEDT